jgi:hypothetical protein
LSDKAKSGASADRRMDERIPINGLYYLFQIEVQGKIFTDERGICTLKDQIPSILADLNDPALNNTVPPSIFRPLPAEYLATPKRLVKRKRLVCRTGDFRHR